MNLLQLILIFLAIIICAAVGYIAWELTADASASKDDQEPGENRRASGPDDSEPPIQH